MIETLTKAVKGGQRVHPVSPRCGFLDNQLLADNVNLICFCFQIPSQTEKTFPPPRGKFGRSITGSLKHLIYISQHKPANKNFVVVVVSPPYSGE